MNMDPKHWLSPVKMAQLHNITSNEIHVRFNIGREDFSNIFMFWRPFSPPWDVGIRNLDTILIGGPALRPQVGPRLLRKIQSGFSIRSPKLSPVRISSLSWDRVLGHKVKLSPTAVPVHYSRWLKLPISGSIYLHSVKFEGENHDANIFLKQIVSRNI